MKNKNLIRSLGALIVLPSMIVSVSAVDIPESTVDTISPQIVLLQKENIENLSNLLVFNRNVEDEEARAKAELFAVRAEAIDTYFRQYDMPLAGSGMKMVEEAEKNDIDWRLLPAIAVIESTGGKFACKSTTHSFFGWGSCKIPFDSRDHAIEVVAWNLGGNNPRTARYYGGKTTVQILQKYNPPHIVPRYANKVISVMNQIGEADLAPARLLSINI